MEWFGSADVIGHDKDSLQNDRTLIKCGTITCQGRGCSQNVPSWNGFETVLERKKNFPVVILVILTRVIFGTKRNFRAKYSFQIEIINGSHEIIMRS